MLNYTTFIHHNLHRLHPVEAFLPFGNPHFEDARGRILIVRLSPFRDVDRSLPHLFLFQEVRRALPDAFVDLAFFPTAGERELFAQEGVPFLLGVQSARSPDEFGLVLISNAYTLELVNLPYLLVNSGVPLFASQRGAQWPLLLLGGSNTMAAQALIRADGDSLVDGIFFGEGEGLVGGLAAALVQCPRAGRRQALAEAARHTPGLWVSGTAFPGCRQAGKPAPHSAGSGIVTAKAVCQPDAHLLPTDYPILNTPEAHTAHLQIAYGCPAFCSFCFEGYDRKPYRELPLADLLAVARRIKQAQGAEEINLYSFNFNTHTDILALIAELHRLFDRVGLKSQRMDILQRTPTLLEAEVEADKRSFTLGIEGISARMRAFLHKSLAPEDVTGLLTRLLAQPIREIKLFYVLTGHESPADLEEFRGFVRWLKETRRARNPGIRVIFSAGLLIRMPFTPLAYDRLFLDEQEWKPIVGPAKSACETNGFEFRLAFDWPAYCTSQVLALGGYWLAEPLVALAQRGYCFDVTLSPGYWEKLRGWMEQTGRWNEAFLGEKGPNYPFPLEFVATQSSPEFLYTQYQEAKSGVDRGYCLGESGRCLACGACVDAEQRRAITQHDIRPPAAGYLARLRETLARKRRLKPVYVRLRLEPWLAGVEPEFLNAFVFKGLLACCPDLTDNLLTVRESLFSVRPNDRRFPVFSGETVFALRAWDAETLQSALEHPEPVERCEPCKAVILRQAQDDCRGFELLGQAEGFTPGEYTRLHLDIILPGDLFPDARARLEQYLRAEYLPYSLRREGSGYRFDLPDKALKKKILFGGFIEATEEGFRASLDVGAKFDLGAFLRAFGPASLSLHAQVRVSGIQW